MAQAFTGGRIMFDIVLSIAALAFAVAVLKTVVTADKLLAKKEKVLDVQIEELRLSNQAYRNAHPGPKMTDD